MENSEIFILAKKILQEEKFPLSCSEIYEIAEQRNYIEHIKSFSQEEWASFIEKICIDIEENPNSSPFKRIGINPKRFILKNIQYESILNKRTQQKQKTNRNSKDELYNSLSDYALKFLKIYTKSLITKNENTSNYIQWLLPSSVGLYFNMNKIHKNKDISLKTEAGKSIIFYSFEIIKRIGYHNLRESYFISASTSLWANKSYLVVYELEDGDDDYFIYDLKKLVSDFGIGIIKLDLNNPDSSNIIYPAKFRNNIDWEALTKLSEENIDFHKLMSNIDDMLSKKNIDTSIFNISK